MLEKILKLPLPILSILVFTGLGLVFLYFSSIRRKADDFILEQKYQMMDKKDRQKREVAKEVKNVRKLNVKSMKNLANLEYDEDEEEDDFDGFTPSSLNNNSDNKTPKVSIEFDSINKNWGMSDEDFYELYNRRAMPKSQEMFFPFLIRLIKEESKNQAPFLKIFFNVFFYLPLKYKLFFIFFILMILLSFFA